MPSAAVLLSYAAACLVIIIVPGPSVTIIVANALRHGTRAGLSSVLGTQIGLATVIGILALGLSAVVSAMGGLFEVLRYAGAAYLVWLGIRMWRSDGRPGTARAAPLPRGSFVLQSFLVVWSNPKVLFFFGAFIPQFIDPAGNAAAQTLLFGLIFMAVAATFDSLYALAAGGAGGWLTRTRVRLVERISGTCLVGGGLWLAFARR